MRRATIGVLAAFHLLQASWLLQGGVDFLFPRTMLLKPGTDACCVGTCGCPEKEQKRKSCCCFPEKDVDAPRPEPVRVPVTAMGELACDGEAPSLAAFFHPPHLPLPAAAPLFVPQAFRLELPELRPDVPPRDGALDKVPL